MPSSSSSLSLMPSNKVHWYWSDASYHNVVSGANGVADGKFNSGDLSIGSFFDFTFTEAGEYPYFCQVHSQMAGTIKVVPYQATTRTTIRTTTAAPSSGPYNGASSDASSGVSTGLIAGVVAAVVVVAIVVVAVFVVIKSRRNRQSKFIEETVPEVRNPIYTANSRHGDDLA